MAVRQKGSSLIKGDDLENWLRDVEDRKSNIIDYSFPSDDLCKLYLETIEQRTDSQIRNLLRCFLIPSGSLGSDEFSLRWLTECLASQKETRPFSEFHRRLWHYGHLGDRHPAFPPPWEGITWVLDLLPHNPRSALNTLLTYFEAHALHMPDGRISGIFDAMEIIRARYIERPRSWPDAIRLLLNESSRTFEHLVERLYAAQGYVTTLTPAQKDGGHDILAVKEGAGSRQKIHIECKKWEGNVGEPIMRALLGVVHVSKATNGICVTTSDLTGPAKKFVKRNPQLDFLSGEMLVRLMNEFMGPTWFFRVEKLTKESLKTVGHSLGQTVENN